MSVDYYARIERQRGPQPSEQMVASIAQGLHLSRAERDHLHLLAGHPAPARGSGTDHVGPGMLRVFDRLSDTPAEIVNELGETLQQNALGAALNGDATRREGPARSIGYRWFTDDAARALTPVEDHAFYSRMYVSGLRGVVALRGPDSRAAYLADLLPTSNEEFRRLWDAHEVDVRPREVKRFLHPEVGPLELSCQVLLDPDVSHMLLVYTAVPGSESHDRLLLLSVLATPPG
ncbi:helix-turn-helix transcriptional regulator [Lapillicoccus jejuensis]